MIKALGWGFLNRLVRKDEKWNFLYRYYCRIYVGTLLLPLLHRFFRLHEGSKRTEGVGTRTADTHVRMLLAAHAVHVYIKRVSCYMH